VELAEWNLWALLSMVVSSVEVMSEVVCSEMLSPVEVRSEVM
jgi:hypothetical protein